MEDRTIDLGGPVHYLDFGGSGRPMVLVHGLGGSALNWMDAAPLLAAHARVFALDLLGHGRTPCGHLTSSVQHNAELIPRFIERLAAGSVVLVGNSMGGYLSMKVAARHPELVEAVVLVDPALPQAPDVIDPTTMQLFAMYATPGVGEQVLRDWIRSAGPEGLMDQMLLQIAHDPARISTAWRAAHVAEIRERQRLPTAVDDMLVAARSLIEGLLNGKPWRESVDRIGAPTLIVHGAHDRLVSIVAARELASIRSDWSLEVMEECGHIPMAEDPAGFTRIVLDWLAALPRSGSRASAAPAS
jgi:pimeloyl-ACP methyl ester carboxylesterase